MATHRSPPRRRVHITALNQDGHLLLFKFFGSQGWAFLGILGWDSWSFLEETPKNLSWILFNWCETKKREVIPGMVHPDGPDGYWITQLDWIVCRCSSVQVVWGWHLPCLPYSPQKERCSTASHATWYPRYGLLAFSRFYIDLKASRQLTIDCPLHHHMESLLPWESWSWWKRMSLLSFAIAGSVSSWGSSGNRNPEARCRFGESFRSG